MPQIDADGLPGGAAKPRVRASRGHPGRSAAVAGLSRDPARLRHPRRLLDLQICAICG